MQADIHCSFIKLMQEDGYTMGLPFPEVPVPTPSLELQKSIVDTAHENGMLTIAHALSNHSTLHVLKAGVDGLAHVAIEPITDELIQAYKKNNAFVIPTLAVQTSCRGVEQETREKFASDLEGEEREHLCGCLNITKQEFSIETAYAQVTALKESGIDVLW
jgi:imidazolonepropionase-like amidohydrolase